MSQSLEDKVRAFFTNPSMEGYYELRDAMVASPVYQPASLAIDQAWDLVDQGRLPEAWQLAQDINQNFFLTPTMHRLMSVLYEAQQDGEKEMEREQYMGAVLARALMQTGDGSPDRPFVVTRVNDEMAILAGLNLTIQAVESTLHKGRLLDVIRTPERGPVHFDVEIPMSAYGREGNQE